MNAQELKDMIVSRVKDRIEACEPNYFLGFADPEAFKRSEANAELIKEEFESFLAWLEGIEA